MKSDRTMPKSDAPNMVEIKFSVSPELLEQALGIGEVEGMKTAEIHRHCWTQGLAAVAEQSNKRLINKKLRAKSAIADLLEDLPTGKYEEAIAYLRNLK